MKKIMALVSMAMMLLIAGCGGGGGGGGESSTPTSAVLKLSATPGSLPAGKTVAGIAATIELPIGVTVKTAADGKTVDPTVVVPSGLGGAGNAWLVSYTAATATSKAKLDFAIAIPNAAAAGVGEGEYVTITFILSGVSPAATDFNVSSFELICLPLNDIVTLTPIKVLTVQ